MGGQPQIQPGANQQPEQLPEKADSKTIPQPAPCLHTLQARFKEPVSDGKGVQATFLEFVHTTQGLVLI
ncbi:hypothetical protein WJX75_008023 [Coccomyxa subellipsoidea]|uniref:Uncharacterized protein n=1 Tax=Coccomyxa subellipsoidea TaxID=248742 RepID=A0ABR2Z4J7_9CHLO